jgi:hypothetical protein
MKNSILFIAILTLLFIACNGNKQHSHQEAGTHTHDDGSVHKDHDANQAKQEEFAVGADTTSHTKDTSKAHSHDGHGHSH